MCALGISPLVSDVEGLWVSLCIFRVDEDFGNGTEISALSRLGGAGCRRR